MEISNKHSEEAWHRYDQYLHQLIVKKKPKTICEIGGGANPAISLSFIQANQMEYTVLDISREELAKAPNGYKKVLVDITSDDIPHLQNKYDFVFSKMLAEHVKCGKTFHNNVRKILRVGGTAFHFFPTLYSFPFFINKLLPENFSDALLQLIAKGRHKQGNHAKFPAYYDMCRGSLKSQVDALEAIGYKIESYVNFFGHDYYRKIPPLFYLSKQITKLLLKFPIPHLASYSYVVSIREV